MLNPHQKLLLGFIHGHIESFNIDERVMLYDALAHILPDGPEAAACRELATTTAELAKLQLDFNHTLFPTGFSASGWPEPPKKA